MYQTCYGPSEPTTLLHTKIVSLSFGAVQCISSNTLQSITITYFLTLLPTCVCSYCSMWVYAVVSCPKYVCHRHAIIRI